MWAAVRKNGDFLTVVNYTIFAAIIINFIRIKMQQDKVRTAIRCTHIHTRTHTAVNTQVTLKHNKTVVTEHSGR